MKERKAIKATHNFDIQTGGKYCLVDASWWETWKSWVAFDDEGDEGGPPRGPRPGIIDNSSLLVEGSTARLRLGLREGLDYEILLLAEWELFEKWYAPAPKLKPVDYAAAAAAPASECGGGGGPTTCGPIVLRRGVKEGGYSSRRSVVELYGLNIKVGREWGPGAKRCPCKARLLNASFALRRCTSRRSAWWRPGRRRRRGGS